MKLIKIVRVVRKCDSVWTNMFDEAGYALLDCNVALNIGPGSKPVRFFNDCGTRLDGMKKQFVKKIEPFLVKFDFGNIDGTLLRNICNEVMAMRKALAEYSPLKPIWREYGGLGDDRGPYGLAYARASQALVKLQTSLEKFLP